MNKSIKINQTLGILFIVGLIVFVSVITLNKANGINQQPVIHKVTADADRYTAGDVEGLVRGADYIALGQFSLPSDTWEMRKDPYYKEGNLYKFTIDVSLLGDLPETIKVGIPHFQRLTTTYNNKEYRADILEPHYVKPDPAKQYVLFLKKVNDIYVPGVSPFIIEINDQDIVTLKYNSDNKPKRISVSATEQIEFSGDMDDYSEIDKITGMNKASLMEAIMKFTP